jgi:hypothetical protein
MKQVLATLGRSVLASGLCLAMASAALAQAPAPAAAKRPDLNGIWLPGAPPPPAKSATCGEQKKIDAFNNDAVERFAANGAKGGSKWITFEQDCGVQHRGRVSKPEYKPQYWELVRKNDYYANAGGEYEQYADPKWKNIPNGVPRIGAPNQIVQIGDQAFFMYEEQNQFRSIPTDCREHDPVLKYDQTMNGLSVGCWEGDTLVVTSMGFSADTWLDWPGYMHSNEMVVIEKFKRDGDGLEYQQIIQDPVMFLRPWVNPITKLNINKTPGAQLMQDVPYIDRSLGKLFDPNYRG